MSEDLDLKTSVQIGDRSVVRSGCVVVTGEETVTFNIADLTFEIAFLPPLEAGPGERSHKAHSYQKDNKVLRLELSGFDSALGTTFSHPTRVATIGEQGLYLIASVHAITGDAVTRVLNYVFSLGGGEDEQN